MAQKGGRWGPYCQASPPPARRAFGREGLVAEQILHRTGLGVSLRLTARLCCKQMCSRAADRGGSKMVLSDARLSSTAVYLPGQKPGRAKDAYPDPWQDKSPWFLKAGGVS